MVIRLSLTLIGTVLLVGCAQPRRVESHAEWLKETTRVYAGEDKARIIAAAEAVLRHADGKDTRFEYNQNGFQAIRAFGVQAIVASIKAQDRWTFSVREGKAGSATALRVIRSGTASAGNKRDRFRENAVYIGSFRLFYARIDYVLGRRPDWVPCDKAGAALGLPAESTGTDLLCGLTHQTSAEPPAKVPPRGSASLRTEPARSSRSDLPSPPELPVEGEE